MCGNEVGVAISIRDPYTSPFASRCKFARCLLLVRCLCSEPETTPELLEVSKRRHNFGTKRFKEKSLFIFHARITLKSLILLFVRLIARGARIGKTHTQTDRQTHRQTDRTSTVTLAHVRRGLITVHTSYIHARYFAKLCVASYVEKKTHGPPFRANLIF